MPKKCKVELEKLFYSSMLLMGSVLLMGFDLSRHNIPVDEILSGGPPKDGIPALLHPKFVSMGEARFLKDDDRVLAIVEGKEAKAYPIRILNWHEVVNDEINGRPIMVSYCPLCGTGMAFDSVINGEPHTFGVSGLLYNSDVLMYDHQTESLWSQIKQEAVTGSMMGTPLRPIFMIHTTWLEWKKEHPDTLVLSTDTGYQRDYGKDPYSGYAQSARLYFSVKNENQDYHPKEWVIGITLNGKSKAYPFSELAKGASVINDQVNGKPIQVHYNDKSRTAFITDPLGKPIPSIVGFWFAWYAFHPDTLIFTSK